MLKHHLARLLPAANIVPPLTSCMPSLHHVNRHKRPLTSESACVPNASLQASSVPQLPIQASALTPAGIKSAASLCLQAHAQLFWWLQIVAMHLLPPNFKRLSTFRQAALAPLAAPAQLWAAAWTPRNHHHLRHHLCCAMALMLRLRVAMQRVPAAAA